MTRLSAALTAACLGLALVLSTSWAFADARDNARQHLKDGVALFQEQNYIGALASFEASYKELPSASALQNIALCQAKLFRYVEAIETIERLKKEFAGTLSAEDAKGVEEALALYSGFVGKLTIHVTPENAQVTLNGKPVPRESIGQPLRLSTGEYKLSAMAPDHSPAEQTVMLAGREDKQVTLNVLAQTAEVTIQVNEPEAFIDIDNRRVSHTSAWKGAIGAGTHQLRVSKPGVPDYQTHFTLRPGEHLEMKVPLGSKGDSEDRGAGDLPYTEGKDDPQRGFYGLFSASLLSLDKHPDDFKPADEADVGGASLGIRGGYRIHRLLALEAVAESSQHSIKGTRSAGSVSSYELDTARLGANARLLLGASPIIRFSGSMGAGVVSHKFEREGVAYDGANAFFQLDAGAQFNAGHVLLEGMLVAFIDGTSKVKADTGSRAYNDNPTVSQIGLALRVGYSQWGRW